MAAHVHAEKMAMFAEDAKHTNKPWELWEVNESMSQKDGVWVEDWEDLKGIPDWNPNVGYRRKLKTTTIAGIEFPIPFKGEFVEGRKYYYLSFGRAGYDVCEIEKSDFLSKEVMAVLSQTGNIFIHEEEVRMRIKALNELNRKILGGE